MSSDSDLPNLVRRGTGVVFAAQIGSQVVSLVGLACLSRLLSPQAFGLIGVALPIVMLPRMAATLGLSTAAIQDAKADDALYSALFWRSLGWSLLAAATTIALGLLFAWIYEMPRLTFVAGGLAVGTLLNALSVVPLAVLERQLRLQAASLARLTAQTLAAISAIAMAWNNDDVSALVVQHSGEFVALAIGVWCCSSWRPRLHQVSLTLETRRFGGWYALGSIVFYAAQNIDKLLLAAWLGASPRGQALLGMYAQSYTLMMRPVYFVTTPLSSVMLPTLARVRDEPDLLADWTGRFYRLTALLLLPAGMGLYLVAGDLMPLLATDWPESGEILATLAPIIPAQGFIFLATLLLAAIKRSDLLCLAAFVQLVLLAQAAWGGASFAASDYMFTAEVFKADEALHHQTLGMATAVTLMTLAIALPYTAAAFFLANVPLVRLFRAVGLPLLAALAMGVIVHVLRQWLVAYEIAGLPRLFLCIATGGLVYGALTWRRVGQARAN